MTINKDQANQTQYGQAGPGANPDDTCPLNNMQVKVRYPGKHGENVLDDHLAFSNIIVPVGQQHIMTPVADIGTTLAAMQTAAYPGTNLSLVHGVIPQVSNPDGATPGNRPFGDVQERKKQGSGTKIPPKSELEDKVYKIVEKGVQHSLEQVVGIPSHAAHNLIAGLKNDGLKSISTAKEAFEKILTGDMLGKLPGGVIPLNDIMSQLSDLQKSEIFQNMPANLQKGLQSTLTLMQSSTGTDAGGFFTDNRVNPEAFLNNVVDKMKDVTTVNGMMDAMQQLTGDTSLHGMDQYANTVIEVEGAFGNVFQEITSTGGVNVNISDGVQNIINQFKSQMAALPGAGGPSGGMFDQSKLKEMFGRLPLAEQTKFRDMIQKNVDSGGAARARLNSVLGTLLGNKTFPG